MLGLQWRGSGFAIAAVAVACGFHFSLDLMVAGQRKQPIEQTENLLKNLRLKASMKIRCGNSFAVIAGRLEEFYEALFASRKRCAPARSGRAACAGRMRHRFASWREPLIRWIDHSSRCATSAASASISKRSSASR